MAQGGVKNCDSSTIPWKKKINARIWGTKVSAPLLHRFPLLLLSLPPTLPLPKHLWRCWPGHSRNTLGLWDEGLSSCIFKWKEKVSQDAGRMGSPEVAGGLFVVMNPICSRPPLSKPFGNALSQGLWTSPDDLLWPTGRQQTMQAENEEMFIYTSEPTLLLVLEPWLPRLCGWGQASLLAQERPHGPVTPVAPIFPQKTSRWMNEAIQLTNRPQTHEQTQMRSVTPGPHQQNYPTDPLTHGK